MNNLYIKEDNQLMIDRIMKLSPDSKAQWGKMNVSGMLFHCSQAVRQGLGEIKIKRSIAGIFFGKIAKKQMLRDETFKKGLPTDKSYIPESNLDFEEQRNILIEKVRELAVRDPESISKDKHPFFGKLTPEEWNTLTRKHLNHHLSQFGA